MSRSGVLIKGARNGNRSIFPVIGDGEKKMEMIEVYLDFRWREGEVVEHTQANLKAGELPELENVSEVILEDGRSVDPRGYSVRWHDEAADNKFNMQKTDR